MNKKILSVFITNLGKYNEGYLIGEWVDLPTSEEYLNEVFERIGINEEYEEYFITDYESDFGIKIGEYENIRELNEKLEDLDEEDAEKVGAMLESGWFRDLDEVIEELDNYTFYEDITAEEYEENLINDCYDVDNLVKGWLSNYITIDYKQMARDDDQIIETTNGVLCRY